MLSTKQVLYYQTFGFLVLRQLLSQGEVRTINEELLHRLGSVFRDTPFDGTARHGAAMMGPDTPFFASLLEDDRFLGAAAEPRSRHEHARSRYGGADPSFQLS